MDPTMGFALSEDTVVSQGLEVAPLPVLPAQLATMLAPPPTLFLSLCLCLDTSLCSQGVEGSTAFDSLHLYLPLFPEAAGSSPRLA